MPSRKEILQKIEKATVNEIAASNPQATRGRDLGPGERRFSNDTGRRRQAPQRRQEPPPPLQYSTKQGQRNAEPPRRSK